MFSCTLKRYKKCELKKKHRKCFWLRRLLKFTGLNFRTSFHGFDSINSFTVEKPLLTETFETEPTKRQETGTSRKEKRRNVSVKLKHVGRQFGMAFAGSTVSYLRLMTVIHFKKRASTCTEAFSKKGFAKLFQ